MKITLFVLFIFWTSLFMSGCSTEQDCFVADSIKELKVSQLNGEAYFLFLRTSGFGEKEHFFELFKFKAKFDDCGQTSSKPIFEVHVDDTEGFPVKLVISDDKMKVVYSATADNSLNLETIKVEIPTPLTKVSN